MRTLDQTVSVVHPGIVAPELAPPDQHQLARRVAVRFSEESTARLVEKVVGCDVDFAVGRRDAAGDTPCLERTEIHPVRRRA